MASVKLDNVVKRFGKVSVVEGFNLEIKDHEFMVLVGPSGCGKSTALRMIAGLEEVTDGQIFIGEKVVNDLPPKDRHHWKCQYEYLAKKPRVSAEWQSVSDNPF